MAEQNDSVKAIVKTSVGELVLELFPDKAPRHVENFLELAQKGFYDGTVFHRTIPEFMIQGGCPRGDGTGGPGYTIDAEFNDVHHERGVLSMARAQDPNSAGSQFFICHGEAGFLDRNYTAFGRMTDGFDVLDKIATAPTQPGGEGSRPTDPVAIETITVQQGA